MDQAMLRLTNSRKPEIPGLHRRLIQRQSQFIHQHQHIIRKLHDTYEHFFEDYKGSEQEMREHYMDPHDKRALRMQAFVELQEEGIMTDSSSSWLRNIDWKIKPAEWNKFRKKPRAICDLGVAASLRGFRVTSFLKRAQDEAPLEIHGGTVAFCKSPDPFALKRHFDNLFDPPGKFYLVYFSDDSCLAVRNERTGNVEWYNLDISSCDASHGPALFDALLNVVPAGRPREDIQLLVNQCKKTLKIVSCSDRTKKIKLIPTVPKLMTGSTLTTAINNLASLLIAVALVEGYPHRAAPLDGEDPALVEAAASAGYILTGCKPLKNFEDVQFLKHSPVLDEKGNWQPMLNLGVLFRASGTCDGDLPGRGPLIERARAFQRGLIRGAYPYCRSEIVDCMSAAMGEGLYVQSEAFAYKVTEDAGTYPPFRADTTSIRKRYNLDEDEYQSVLRFARAPPFTFHSGPGLDKFLRKDYDMETVEVEDVKYVTQQACERNLICV